MDHPSAKFDESLSGEVKCVIYGREAVSANLAEGRNWMDGMIVRVSVSRQVPEGFVTIGQLYPTEIEGTNVKGIDSSVILAEVLNCLHVHGVHR
jgi:hypothetical protein